MVVDTKQDREGREQEAGKPAAETGASFGAYSQGSSLALDLSPENWEKERREEAAKPWHDSATGRLAIRAFSRGILGAAFFTWGGLKIKHDLHDVAYNPNAKAKNLLQHIAKFFDTVAGKPIELAVNMAGGDGRNAVRFRPTRYAGYGDGSPGRSLGHEIVAVTFDFAMASIGDALGRDIAALIDPNVKKKWMDEKGHVLLPEALKGALKTAWRYVSYNAGEDWAVALPYVYQMRMQRNLINNFRPGFEYDSDRSLNGGSVRVDEHDRIIGNYNKPGALDLQLRFTGYNVGTLMFREAYDYVANKIQGRPATLYGSANGESPHAEKSGVFGSIATLAKWTARSFVKGFVYMTPAVPFFWITRTPQTKSRGLAIHPENGIVSYDGHLDGRPHKRSLYASDMSDGVIPADTPLFHGCWDHSGKRWRSTDAGSASNPFVPPFDAYERSFGPADTVLNAFGKANDRTRQWVESKAGAYKGFARGFVNASIAYTPYMYMKAETANRWDTGKMDQSVERAVDGVAKLNMGEFKEGCREIWHSFWHNPLPDPERERMGKRRDEQDTSGADVSGRRETIPDVLYRKPLTGQVRQQKADTFAESLRAQAEPPASRASSFAEQVQLRHDRDKDGPAHTIH